MTDNRNINVQIAELLQAQSYSDRLEMARWFAEVLSDAKSSMSAEEGFTPDDLAGWFENWAEYQMEEVEG